MKVYLVVHSAHITESFAAALDDMSRVGEKTLFILGAYLSEEKAEKAIRKQMAYSKNTGYYGTRDNWHINVYEAE